MTPLPAPPVRREDLDAQLLHRGTDEGPDPLDEPLPWLELRLAHEIDRRRHDPAALLAFLAALPPVQRLPARVVAIRQLGSARGVELCARAFGPGHALFPVLPGPAERPLQISHRDRAARKLIEGQLIELAALLALDPWGIEIVVDQRAAWRLAGLGVRGLQEGSTVYLHPERYDPASEDGRYLLAHELVHARQRALPASGLAGGAAEAEATGLGRGYAQGRGLRPPTVGLNGAAAALEDPTPDEEKLLAAPPLLNRQVLMTGAVYRPKADLSWIGGIDKKKQAFAAFVQDLVTPAKYSVRLVNDALAARGGLGTVTATGNLDGKATQDDHVQEFTVENTVVLQTAAWLASKGYKTTLTAENLETLQGGVDAADTWPDIAERLPRWWTQGIYRVMMGVAQKTLLTRYGKALRALKQTPSDQADKALSAVRMEVYKALTVPAGDALEVIRRDVALAKEPAYRVLWKLPAPQPGAPPAEVKVGADGPVDSQAAVWFMTDCLVEPDRALAASAPTSPQARKQLIDRFATRLSLRKLPIEGDSVLHDGAAKATRPPLSSSMRAWPALEPPFYDVPKGGEREFVMSVGFPDVFEAFRGYRYKWELLEVPDEDVKKLAEYEDPREKAAATGGNPALQGAQPGQMSVLGNRLERDIEDGKADIKRSIFSLSNLLGPPGTGATSLVTANAMLRMVGTVLRTFIETLTKPSYEKTMPLPRDGLYVVRCTAWPTPMEASIIDRAPSVAWVPVWVRPAQQMSKLRVHLDTKLRSGAIERLKAIEEALKDPALKDPAQKAQRDALEAERDRLRKLLFGKGGDQLELEKAQLNEALKQKPDSDQKERIEKRIAEIDEILKMRKDRLAGLPGDPGLEGVIQIPAAFVGDKGQTMRPLFEAFQQKASSGFTYHVIDSTTKNSGHRDGSGATREDAIVAGVVAILESDQGYGRGFVTLNIPAGPGGGADVERPVRIEKSQGALVMEAIENVATVASIAAIAAAPFTAGASLSLLVPIGVIGAIPSAYRLLERAEQGTLRLDMAAVLDIVNILGAAIGAGTAKAASSAALRGVPLSRGYMILGLGNDGLGFLVAGAAFVDGINELDKDKTMPAGLRAARIAELVGQQLLQVGLAVGAHLVSHAQAEIARYGGKAKGAEALGPRVGPEVTAKFHEAVGPKGAEIPVVRDEKGVMVKGDGVEIVFSHDGYGLPTDARVVMGPTATEAGLLGHAKAARAVVEYQGFIGYLRNLLDRLIVLFKSGKLPPKPGSRAWNAKVEIEKLSGVVARLNNDLGRGAITPEAYASKLRDYQEQMAKHERALNDYSQGPGIIAAHDNVTRDAQAKGYPAPPKDHFYFETEGGKYQLQRAADSDAAPHHIEWREGRPVLVAGEVAHQVVDLTHIQQSAQQQLGKKVVLHGEATFDHVSVRPMPDGSYEVHFKKGTPEHRIQAAIERQIELRGDRPKDLKDPVRPDGTRWSGADEAAYQGRPTEEGYYWALSDGKLQYVSKDLEKYPKKVWDEKQGRPVLDTGTKTEPSFKVGEKAADAFDLLGGNDPTSEFGAWVKACKRYLNLNEEALIKRMKDPSGKQHRTVRHGLKEDLTPELVKKISLDKNGVANDRTLLRAEHPELYQGATTEADLKKADKAASHRELLELTRGLGSADRGSIAEQWYKANYSPNAERHVTFKKEEMKALGIELDIDREPDIVDGKKIREIKHVSGPLKDRDTAELTDYAKLLDKTIKVGETTYTLKEMVVVFPEPVGGSANAENIARMVKADARLSFEIFNSAGEKKTITQGDLKKGKFNTGGQSEGLVAAIKEFCK